MSETQLDASTVYHARVLPIIAWALVLVVIAVAVAFLALGVYHWFWGPRPVRELCSSCGHEGSKHLVSERNPDYFDRSMPLSLQRTHFFHEVPCQVHRCRCVSFSLVKTCECDHDVTDHRVRHFELGEMYSECHASSLEHASTWTADIEQEYMRTHTFDEFIRMKRRVTCKCRSFRSRPGLYGLTPPNE